MLFRRALTFSAPALTALAWRNRDEIVDWAGFGLRAALAAVPGGDDFDDVRSEARLRLALVRERRIRADDGLRVEVRDGVATLRGRVRGDVRELAVVIAKETGGILGVDDRTKLLKSGVFNRAR